MLLCCRNLNKRRGYSGQPRVALADQRHKSPSRCIHNQAPLKSRLRDNELRALQLVKSAISFLCAPEMELDRNVINMLVEANFSFLCLAMPRGRGFGEDE